jgi:hypothetical protein
MVANYVNDPSVLWPLPTIAETALDIPALETLFAEGCAVVIHWPAGTCSLGWVGKLTDIDYNAGLLPVRYWFIGFDGSAYEGQFWAEPSMLERL